MSSSVSPQSNGPVMPFRPRTILLPVIFSFHANLTIAPVGNAGRPIVTHGLITSEEKHGERILCHNLARGTLARSELG